jgi:hypothetical protein
MHRKNESVESTVENSKKLKSKFEVGVLSYEKLLKSAFRLNLCYSLLMREVRGIAMVPRDPISPHPALL